MALEIPSNPGYHHEYEKKFLPKSLAQLPPLESGTDIMQFYFPSNKALIIDGVLHYTSRHNPLLKLTSEDLQIVEQFLAWPKPPKVRIRLSEKRRDCKAFITIKVAERAGLGESLPADSNLIKNLEFEREISPDIAEKLLYHIGGHTKNIIAKTRFEILHTTNQNGLTEQPFRRPFEIDLFKGPSNFSPKDRRIIDNSGLVVIELEIGQDEEVLPSMLPKWVGRDITSDRRFTNSKLSQMPFAKWSESEKKRTVLP